MKKIYVGSLLALTVLSFACKKNKDKSVADMLQGKWYLTDEHWMSHYNGNDYPDSSIYYRGEVTLEFKGNVATGISSSGTETHTFKVIDGPKLVTEGGDTSDVRKLTDSELSLFSIDRSSPGTVTEYTENYKKY